MAQVYFNLIKYHTMTIDAVPEMLKAEVMALLTAAGLDSNGQAIDNARAD